MNWIIHPSHEWVRVSDVADLDWCWRCGALSSVHSGTPVFLLTGEAPQRTGDKRLEARTSIPTYCIGTDEVRS